MVQRKLTKAEDQFGRIYYYDKKSQEDTIIDETLYGNDKFDVIYDIRGFLVFNVRILNVDSQYSVNYLIEETTKNFKSLSELIPSDWVAVDNHNDKTLTVGDKRSEPYSLLMSSGIRAVKVQFKRTTPNNTKVQTHATGEL